MTRRQVLALGLTVPTAWISARCGRPEPAKAAPPQAAPPSGGGLGGFTTGPPACSADRKLTPAIATDRDFKPGSPERTSLRESGMEGKALSLSGYVIGLR